MDYKIIIKSNPDELEKEVARYLSIEYILQGGVSVVFSEVSGIGYCQAMTKII